MENPHSERFTCGATYEILQVEESARELTKPQLHKERFFELVRSRQLRDIQENLINLGGKNILFGTDEILHSTVDFLQRIPRGRIYQWSAFEALRAVMIVMPLAISVLILILHLN